MINRPYLVTQYFKPPNHPAVLYQVLNDISHPSEVASIRSTAVDRSHSPGHCRYSRSKKQCTTRIWTLGWAPSSKTRRSHESLQPPPWFQITSSKWYFQDFSLSRVKRLPTNRDQFLYISPHLFNISVYWSGRSSLPSRQKRPCLQPPSPRHS